MDRAERRRRTDKVIESRMVFLKRIYGDSKLPKSKVGRCKKHHPYDCGNPQCFCCHSDKIGGKPSIRDRRHR